MAAIAIMALSCGVDDDTSTPAEAVMAEAPAEAPALPAEVADGLRRGEVRALVSALGRRHAAVRGALGAHRVHYTSKLSLVPEPPADALPALDAPVPLPSIVADELDLKWLPDDERGPRFSLAQHNDQQRGRDVLASQGRLYTKLEHRGWQHAAVETDVHELWLDDAFRGPGDLVALAAPWLAVTVTPRSGEGWQGGDALAMSLQMADAPDPALAEAASGWRADITFEQISGEVLVDANSGAWLQAQVELSYAVPAPGGRKARGTASLTGTLQSLPEGASITVPGDSVPVYERERYEVERARLLDGLAAP